ncbi:DUF6953 family protein [Nitrosomonas sp. ANs5]|uniref:DUF6953 family protein n=1 Tax=Nitrosomonas sp. ANs5 TaxID=3423941 RepID=UPI003D33CA94
MPTTAKDVAQWMLDEINNGNYLYQEQAAYTIFEMFGDDFVYYNDNGNLAIEKKVLNAFRTLTDDSVVWSRSEKMWRLREDYDEPGRMQY